ncbi:MAG TPA: hypothetical protein VN895_06985 [Candidatus Acidoferrum sp.]|nr:hypothetical protein [Candidatus Acidoferrum sp.]
MKRMLTSVTGALILAGFATTTALTAPATASTAATSQLSSQNTTSGSHPSIQRGAIVAKGAPCLVPVPGQPAGITTDSHSVITPTGNVTLTCHTSGPKRGATFSGTVDQACFTSAGITSGHLVATRSGRVNLSCHVHPQTAQSSVHSQAAAHRWQHGAVAGVGPKAKP